MVPKFRVAWAVAMLAPLFGAFYGPARADLILADQGVTLAQLDMRSGATQQQTVACTGKINGVAVLQRLNMAYVTASVNGVWSVCMLNLTTNAVMVLDVSLTNAAGDGPFPIIRISPDAKTALVTDPAGSRIYPITLGSNTVGSPIGGFDMPSAVTFSADSRFAYIANSGDFSIERMDLDDLTLTHRIFLRTELGHPLTGIEVSNDGLTAFVTMKASSNLAIVNLSTNSQADNVALGGMAGQMAVHRSQETLYITAKKADGSIVAQPLSMNDLSLAAPIPLRDEGDAGPIVISNDGSTIFAAAGNLVVPFDAKLHIVVEAAALIGTPPLAGTPPVGLAALPQVYQDTVYFIGDSVTAGFGYCGPGDIAGLLGRNCGVDSEFGNGWTPVSLLAYPLSYCAPSDPAGVDDRCSNNNYPGGAPWGAPRWTVAPGEPRTSYSFQLGLKQAGPIAAEIYNWAITGSEPKDWEPGSTEQGLVAGRFAPMIAEIRYSYVVMTLGANPILSEYLNLSVAGSPYAVLKKGKCADTAQTTKIDPRTGKNAGFATLSDVEPAHVGLADGVGVCMDDEWKANGHPEHLQTIYKALLGAGNRVVVVGYPPVCPWSFGSWQPTPNPTSTAVGGGPAKGYPCDGQIKDADFAVFGEDYGPSSKLSQADQAYYLGTLANGWIAEYVAEMNNPNIIFVAPSEDWKQHQAWHPDSWVFKNDTWVHPSKLGHTQLARGVSIRMCEWFDKWCGWDSNTLKWR
jgi:DNA-binding beta-propeller fold protein YncE